MRPLTKLKGRMEESSLSSCNLPERHYVEHANFRAPHTGFEDYRLIGLGFMIFIILVCFVYSLFYVRLKNFSLVWRRHHYR
jgi:hypothetical protein